MEEFKLVIVGGGPNALYVLERLSSLGARQDIKKMSVYVIDKDGHFGSGCHYSGQPKTNHLNRIALQVGFGSEVGVFSKTENLITLYDWCLDKYSKTGLDKYDIDPQDWIERSLFGEISEDVFNKVIQLIRTDLDVEVMKIQGVVENVIKSSSNLYDIVIDGRSRISDVNHVILCTGHGPNLIQPDSIENEYYSHHLSESDFNYFHHIYPIESSGFDSIDRHSKVLVKGMGLASLDFLLYLTEARGGEFIKDNSEIGLRYLPSGNEPKKISLYSGSGVFLLTKAVNQKLNDSDLFHQGIFFCDDNINRVKEIVGAPLDFKMHVLPLIKVEMHYVYYKTLLGEEFVSNILTFFQEDIVDWLRKLEQGELVNEQCILNRVAIKTNEQLLALDSYLLASHPSSDLKWSESWQALKNYVSLCYAKISHQKILDDFLDNDKSTLTLFEVLSSYTSIPGYDKRPSEFIFDFDALLQPFPLSQLKTEDSVKSEFLEDIRRARRGNIDDPTKACIDGVLRDCRDTLRLAIENGELSARSSHYFFCEFSRVINRLAVGTSLPVMEKIYALVDAGIIDLTDTQINKIELVKGGVSCTWSNGNTEHFENFVNASVHKFDVKKTASVIYQNTLNQNLIREFVLTDLDGFTFHSGCVETDIYTQSAINMQGEINKSISILGVPTEGQKFFHLAAYRPYCDDPVIKDAEHVIKCVIDNYLEYLSQEQVCSV